MTYPKIKPCPRCADGGDPDRIEYDHGWKHVECFKCDLLGPGEGRYGDAIKSWNAMPAHGQSEQPVSNPDEVGDIDTIGSHAGNGGRFDPLDGKGED